MRIVNRQTFLAMPSGTVYSKYVPCMLWDIAVKKHNCNDNDWFYVAVTDVVGGEYLECGDSFKPDFDVQGRDGCFDADQLFAIYEPEDVAGMIAALQRPT